MSATMTKPEAVQGLSAGSLTSDILGCNSNPSETYVEIKKRGDLYEIFVNGDRSEEVVASILKGVLRCGGIWSCDGKISLGGAH